MTDQTPPPRDTRPRIVCAAIKLPEDGLIVTGARHYCETMVRQLQAMNRLSPAAEQGFIDQYGAFYNRQEAYLVAVEMGQYKPWGHHTPGVLYSEDLY